MGLKYITIEDGRIDIFDERWYIKKHIRYPSVTFVQGTEIHPRLLKWSIEHGTNTYYILEEKQEIGSTMHHYIQILIEEGKVTFENRPPNTKESRAFEAWKRVMSFNNFYQDTFKHHTVLGVEETVYNEEIMVAGTLDAKTELAGKVHIWDWKSSKDIQEHHKQQVSTYAYTVGADYAHVVAFPEGGRVKRGYKETVLDRGQIERYYGEFLELKKRFDKEHSLPAYMKYPVEITLKEEKSKSLFR